MPIIYQCRHCGQKVGELEKKDVDRAMLGLHRLSDSEQKEMIHTSGNGELQIKVICESCESAFAANPHYHEFDYFIH